MIKFEFVEKYKDCGLALPVRKTAHSAGYDFQVAEDTLVPPYAALYDEMYADCREELSSAMNVAGISQSHKH